MTIKYSSDFITDLDTIESLYRDNYFLPKAGKKLISEILNICDSIGKYPMMGADFGAKDERGKKYRYMVHGNYLLFYTIENEGPLMLRVLDGRMDYLRIIFEDDLPRYNSTDDL